ncbi:MAG TPA: hypothetical protein VM619_16335 [Luteimonas sp.]|nr:hypothetical protein [Luteimonas sp.]
MNGISSPLKLWETLQKEAGLEIWRGRRKLVPGRDADVETAVKIEFGFGGRSETLAACLTEDAASHAPRITTERLLVALLSSQRGFGDMMKDMLELLTDANANRDGAQLDVQFRFDEVDDPIRLTLEQFRATVEQTTRMLVSKYELPPKDIRWQLKHELDNHAGHLSQSLADSDCFPDIPSPPPATSHETLDAAIASIHALVVEFVTLCASLSSTRRNAFVAAQSADDYLRDIAVDATDYWDVSVNGAAQRIADGVSEGRLDPDAILLQLKPLLGLIEHRSQWVDQVYQELLDLLRLPVWSKRHELFSVWNGSILLRVAKASADLFHFHARDGALSFAFNGNRLATYESGGEQFDIWAELRSDLVVTSRKRKKGIQPDFRVVRSSLGDVNDATRLVLECKHYLTPSNSNFSNAASDYARNCQNAFVVVSNHGPLNQASLMASIDQPLHSRTMFLGGVSVTDERNTNRLGKVIWQALFPSRATMTEPPTTIAIATVILRWDDSLQDMDLAIEFERDGTTHRVDFANKGELGSFPYARLDHDQQSGPGEERIDISAWQADRYLLSARNYTGAGHGLPHNLSCTIQLGSDPEQIVACPGIGPHDTWRIALIEIKYGKAAFRSAS